MTERLPGHPSGISAYTVTGDVQVAIEVLELLFFDMEEKVVHVEVLCTNFQLTIQVQQLKHGPGVAEDKLLFQVVLFGDGRVRQETVWLVPLSKLAVPRLLCSLPHSLES